jgi:phosphatidylinositol glycan class M
MFYYDLWLCLLVQTWSFVIFNKVMTAQYYPWYFCLMPIAVINSELATKNFKKLFFLLVLWTSGQATWGYFANEFENFGNATVH